MSRTPPLPSPITLGRLYYEAVTSSKSLELMPQVPHTIRSSDEGLQILHAAIEQHCRAD